MPASGTGTAFVSGPVRRETRWGHPNTRRGDNQARNDAVQFMRSRSTSEKLSKKWRQQVGWIQRRLRPSSEEPQDRANRRAERQLIPLTASGPNNGKRIHIPELICTVELR